MRRPIDQAGASPRQAIWTAIRGARKPASARQLEEKLGIHRKTVCDYLLSLAAGGYLGLVHDAEMALDRQYELIRDVGGLAPRVRRDGTEVQQGGGTEAMWRTMQVLGEFTSLDLAQHATTDRGAVSEETAKSYASLLFRAGYLTLVRKAEPVSGRLGVYRLIRRSGPRPPQIQRVKRVYDPNTGETFETGVKA